jgi:hypothetical protein
LISEKPIARSAAISAGPGGRRGLRELYGEVEDRLETAFELSFRAAGEDRFDNLGALGELVEAEAWMAAQ